jgi:hypothetical protein
MKKIIVTFDTHGGSRIEAFGFKGAECLKATKSFEQVLGKTSAPQPKPEMKLKDSRRVVVH